MLLMGFLYAGLSFLENNDPFALHLGNFWDLGSERYSNIYYASLIGLGFLVDRFLDRIQAIVAGLLACLLGYLLLFIGGSWLIAFGKLALIAGIGLGLVAFLAYLGSANFPQRSYRYVSLLFAFGALALGAAILPLIAALQAEIWYFIGTYVVLGFLLCLCFLIVVLLLRKRVLPPDQKPVSVQNWGYLGFALYGLFPVLMLILVIAVETFGLSLQSEFTIFYGFGLIFLLGAGIVMFRSRNYPKESKISLGLLLLISLSFWLVHNQSAEYAQLGFHSLWLNIDSFYTPSGMAKLVTFIAGAGMGVFWMLRPTRKKLFQKALFILLIGMVVLMLVSWITNEYWIFLHYPFGVVLMTSILYQMAYAVVLGTLAFVIWEVSPSGFQTVSLAILLAGEFFTKEVGAFLIPIFGDGYEFGMEYSATTPMIGLLGILLLGGLIFYRIRASWS